MALSNDLISQFIKTTNDTSRTKKDTLVYGTVFSVGDKGNCLVTLDGATQTTPAISTSTVEVNDRVMITIKNHTAIITGNLTDRSASAKSLGNLNSINSEAIERLDVAEAEIGTLRSELGKFDELITTEFDAVYAEIDKIVAGNIESVYVTTKYLEANYTTTTNLNTKLAEINDAVITRLDVVESSIITLNSDLTNVNQLIANKADVSELDAIVVDIQTLNSNLITTNDLVAKKAATEDLNAAVARIKSIEGNYANINFTNIGKAAMEYFYANSGLIKDVVVGDSTITGELVGVTLKGDLIEGNTIKAEKLVIKGSDGLYYKLNIDGGTFTDPTQAPTDTLHGSVITANSITADKISVKDLVAFGATIGGFTITNNSIHSIIKDSAGNTIRGIYFDNDGQFSIGDASNYLKYHKDSNGNYKLDISAQSVSIKTGDTTTNIEDAFDDVKAVTVTDTTVQYALSDLPSVAPTSGWSAVAPDWTTGKYMWQKTVTTYGNGTKKESDPTCISGATGQNGEDATVLRIDSSRGTVFKNNTVETILSVVIYNGSHRITSIETLKSVYGPNAYLQWSWQRMDEDRFGDILSTDPRIKDDGFTFTLSAEDVDTKVVFMCSLNI